MAARLSVRGERCDTTRQVPHQHRDALIDRRPGLAACVRLPAYAPDLNPNRARLVPPQAQPLNAAQPGSYGHGCLWRAARWCRRYAPVQRALKRRSATIVRGLVDGLDRRMRSSAAMCPPTVSAVLRVARPQRVPKSCRLMPVCAGQRVVARRPQNPSGGFGIPGCQRSPLSPDQALRR